MWNSWNYFFKRNKFKISGKEIVRRMSKRMDSRGPDAMKFWSNENDKIVLGHNRLSIIDLSKKGDQPMISNCKRYVIVFNGEIYNFEKLKIEIKKRWIYF